MNRTLAMAAVLASAFLSWPRARGADFYLSANGSDAAAGTKEQPFATPERARDAARALRKKGRNEAINVWLAGGTYPRDKAFTLSAEDSGSADAPVTYRALPGQSVRLLAGRPITAADVRAVDDPDVISRLDAAARGRVVQLDLGALGVRHAGPFPDVFDDGGGIVQLYFDGRRMPLSRWPKEGYATIAKVIDRGDWSKGPGRHGGAFAYSEDRPGRWKADRGVWLQGFWRVPWEPKTLRVQSIDPAARRITFAEPISAGIGSKYTGPEGSGKETWCALNLLEEITRPGEWCIDFESHKLYFWPPAPADKVEIFLADMDEPLVRLDGASHVTLRGLQLEGGLGDGAEVRGGEDDLVAGCTLCRLGRYGVVIKGGRHDGAQSCDFFDLGFGGILVGGGDRKTLSPADHFVVNNHIHHFGRVKKTYAPGIGLGAYGAGDAVGCRLEHNLIHDAPHAAVLYGGNDHLVEFNEVYAVALDSGDVGAFYTWNDWTSRGNVLRYNFVHDNPKANAFYMDDGDSGDTIFGNVVYRCIYGPFIGGGHDNLVRNNLIISCERGVHLDARGAARGYDATSKSMVARLKSVDYQRPPWSVRYPELVNLLESHPELPTGSAIENNVLVDCKMGLHLGGTKEELRFCSIRDNLELPLAEVGMTGPEHLDFRLKPDSPVFRRLPDFKPIPFERIGLYTDADRTTLPTRTAATRPANAEGATGAFDSNLDVKKTDQQRGK